MPTASPAESTTSCASSRPASFRDAAGLVGLNLRRLLIFPLNRVVHFAAMDRNFARRVDAQPDPVAADVHDRDDHVVADDDAFVALSGEYQHNVTRSAQG